MRHPASIGVLQLKFWLELEATLHIYVSSLPLLPPDKLGSYEEEEEGVSDSEQVIQAPTVWPLHDFTSIGFLESHAMRRIRNNHHHHRLQTFVEL